jgi:hypothetical protein
MAAFGDRLQLNGSVFFSQPDNLLSYQEKSRRLIESLRQTHSYFETWYIVDKGGELPLQSDLSDLEPKILSALSDSKVSDLINSDSTSRLGPETMNRIGFFVTYVARPRFIESLDNIEDREIELSLRGNSAGAEPHGGVILNFPASLDRTKFSAQYLRQIVGVIASICELTVVAVGSPKFEATIRQDGDLYAGVWMNYYRLPYISDCLPRNLDWMNLESGILLQLGTNFPDPSNPSDIAAAKRLREALDHLGLVWHSTYAIHGWPPDEEEWRYEEFITGAPRDRKYRVRCIDFDGYDSQRDVLLYAKLFRRLRQQRKEWGLRGWDGPVLNEARRQVRAANGTQIEWHIGLEEPAARVRTLLADYTDFKEEQLRVIYTPLSQMAAR